MSNAIYTEAPLPEYWGNPLIEALPPLERSDTELAKAMVAKPRFALSERSLSTGLRREVISRLKGLFVPLPPHFELLERISTCLRRSYTWRNPSLPQTQLYLHKGSAAIFPPEWLSARTTAGSLVFVKGISGIGKSAGIEACLRALGDQVICHEAYKGRLLPEKQIVWLKFSCPEDRSLKSLCIAILVAVDRCTGTSTYVKDYVDDPRTTKGSYLMAVMHCLATYHVGILVVDELQNLFASKGQPALEVLNFLLRIRDESGICLILCGTYASLEILENKFRLSRRLAADGTIEFARSASWEDRVWIEFCQTLWNYQWVAKPSEFCEQIATTLHDLTQAIRGLAIPLFMRAQEDAIADHTETVSPSSLRLTWRKHFSQLDNPLSALRSGDAKALAKWDDLCDSFALGTIHSGLPRERNCGNLQISEHGATCSINGQKKSSRGSSEAKKSSPDRELERLADSDGLDALRAAGVVGTPG